MNKLKKLVTCKWTIAAIVVIVGYLFFFSGKAEAATFDAEIGKYEKRIDSGAYSGAEDSLYYKLSADIPVFSALGLAGNLEYVDSDVTELYLGVGTTLSTPIGDVGAGVELSQVDGEADVYELVGSYDLTLFDAFTTTIDAAVNEDSEGNIDASVEQLLFSNDTFDIIGGGAIGSSFGTDDDYTYTLAFARVQIDALYAQYNYLKNDITGAGGTDDSWQGTLDFGLAFQF